MKTSVRNKLGSRIKELRKELGYTQAKLAELVGVDYKYLQKIEGKTPPAVRIDTMEKIAKALKVSLSELTNF